MPFKTKGISQTILERSRNIEMNLLISPKIDRKISAGIIGNWMDEESGR